MENKINIAELLKDCPKGMELYSPIFGEVYLDKIRPHLSIVVATNKEQGDFKEEFLYDGRYGMNGECMLFPSKGKTTWEGFQRPFKDGDIVSTLCGGWIGIVKKPFMGAYETYITICDEIVVNNNSVLYFDRFATEEEKQKLFSVIKANGYKWNAETKTLENLTIPKFKVGDKIRSKKDAPINISNILITKVDECGYKGVIGYTTNPAHISFKCQDLYELVHSKFDITTLVPFESRVLVRDCNQHEWEGEMFTRYTNKSFNNCNFVTLGGRRWKQCIPYNDNTKHLLGTINDCDEYFKNWE